MKPDRVHLQLTGRCNLACTFCGQEKGLLACQPENELSLSEWLRVVSELDLGTKITLWGGEPLLWDGFDALARELHARGFELSVITNGTLIDQHFEVLNQCFTEIFVSIDGEEAEHDAIRGAGVFASLKRNLPLLDCRNGKLIFMSVMLDEKCADLPFRLAYLKPDEWIFSQLIYLSAAEYEAYQRTAPAPYPELSRWIMNDDGAYLPRLTRALEQIERNKKSYPFKVSVTPHDYPGNRFSGCKCPAMNKRLHIRHDGESGFCTDFFGISLGNVRNTSIPDIWNGAKASALRDMLKQEPLPICRHCPWFGQQL